MKKIVCIILLLFPALLFAQQNISLKMAIDSALKNNFELIIAKNNAEISKINNSFANAGGLPTIGISATDNETVYNINQKLNTGTENFLSNVMSNNLNSGINASITLFNGMKVMATKERLRILQNQGELLLNQQIQNTISSIMLKYFDIIRQQSYLKILQASYEVSNKKHEIVSQRKLVGMANDADFLQSQIDLNESEQKIKFQEIYIEQAKNDLLQLMCVKNFKSIIIQDSIILDKPIILDSVLSSYNKNLAYLNAEYILKSQTQILKEISSYKYPILKANAGYNYILSQSDFGTYLYNQNFGPIIGATLQIPLYNGNLTKNQQKIAQININNAMQLKESIENTYKTTAIKTYLVYNNALKQIVEQKNNCSLANDLVQLVIKKFQVNQATIIEVRNAQLSFENANYNLINHLYTAKSCEIELYRLMYKINY